MRNIQASIKLLKAERKRIDRALAILEKAVLVTRGSEKSRARVRGSCSEARSRMSDTSTVKKRGPYKKTRERLAATNKAFGLIEHLQGADDPRCGRGECTHHKLEHTKKDQKCSRCWCYGFVQRAA